MIDISIDRLIYRQGIGEFQSYMMGTCNQSHPSSPSVSLYPFGVQAKVKSIYAGYKLLCGVVGPLLIVFVA